METGVVVLGVCSWMKFLDVLGLKLKPVTMINVCAALKAQEYFHLGDKEKGWHARRVPIRASSSGDETSSWYCGKTLPRHPFIHLHLRPGLFVFVFKESSAVQNEKLHVYRVHTGLFTLGNSLKGLKTFRY